MMNLAIKLDSSQKEKYITFHVSLCASRHPQPYLELVILSSLHPPLARFAASGKRLSLPAPGRMAHRVSVTLSESVQRA